MQVPIDEIIVNKRLRKDLGDISSLAASIKKFGQINPIVINRKKILIAGERRLEAAKVLGWKAINAVMVDISDPLEVLEYEIEENIQRQEFSPEETAEASRRIYQLKNPPFFLKIWISIKAFFKRLFKRED